jgi:eukaryotic-like serine/threonine-protein kinase
MKASDYQQLRLLFDELADLASAEQLRRLAEIKQENSDLAAELRALLEIESSSERLQTNDAKQSMLGAMQRAETNAWIGKTLDRYEIMSELGKGGMGIVFKAVRRDQDLEQFVAIKLLRRGMVDPSVLGRFLRERKFLASLRHPNICSFVDSGMADDGTPYVVMELLEGQDLLGYAKQQALPIAERVQLFIKVLQAVAHAHRNLIIHRDVKPSNILVDANGHPKLLDFGIARSVHSHASAAQTER